MTKIEEKVVNESDGKFGSQSYPEWFITNNMLVIPFRDTRFAMQKVASLATLVYKTCWPR